jgi:hypothetical protein
MFGTSVEDELAMPVDPWPFQDPPDLAVISLRNIVFDGSPILHVTHDRDDQSWQFLGSGGADERDACVVGLGEMWARDASIAELIDLPLGWHAWRATASSPWQRGPNPSDQD